MRLEACWLAQYPGPTKSPSLELNLSISGWWFHICLFWIFTLIFGEMIQFDYIHVFQMGWFNHQLVYIYLHVVDFYETCR